MNKPISNKICVLYNRKGEIVHTHRVVTFPGGRIVPDEEVEARAKTHATAAGHDISSLTPLRLDGEMYDSTTTYRVDVEKKKLVKTG